MSEQEIFKITLHTLHTKLFYVQSIATILFFSFSPYLSIIGKSNEIIGLVSIISYIIIFGSFLIILLSNTKLNKKWFLSILLFLAVFLFYLIRGITNPIAGIRGSIIETSLIVILFLFFKAEQLQISEHGKKNILNLLIFCALINTIVSIYQISTFDGNFKNLYISSHEYSELNLIRNGRLRAIGLLDSATILSSYLMAPIAVCFTILLHQKSILQRKSLMYFILFIILFTGLYLTGSRVPLFSISISMAVAWLYKKTRLSVNVVYIDIFALVLIFALLILSPGFTDESGLARLQYYMQFFELLKVNPLGYGIGYAQYPYGITGWDISLATIGLNYGIIGLCFYFILFIKTLFYLSRLVKKQICENAALELMILNSWFINSFFVNIFSVSNLMILIVTLFVLNSNSIEKRLTNL